MTANAIWRTLLTHWLRRAASRACWTAGRSNATKIPMMAITTSKLDEREARSRMARPTAFGSPRRRAAAPRPLVLTFDSHCRTSLLIIKYRAPWRDLPRPSAIPLEPCILDIGCVFCHRYRSEHRNGTTGSAQGVVRFPRFASVEVLGFSRNASVLGGPADC